MDMLSESKVSQDSYEEQTWQNPNDSSESEIYLSDGEIAQEVAYDIYEEIEMEVFDEIEDEIMEEIEQGETFEAVQEEEEEEKYAVEEEQYSYDLDTVIAEITAVKPRQAKQIYVDKRCQEIKATMKHIDVDDLTDQVQEEWKKMTKKQKQGCYNIQNLEKNRYNIAMGDKFLRPPNTGYSLFRSLCYKLVQQRNSSLSHFDILKKLRKIWKDFSQDIKIRYDQRKAEMQEHFTKGLPRKQQLLQKIPNPRSAYSIYQREHSKRIYGEHGGVRNGATRVQGEEWRNLGEEGQRPYHKRAEGERKRYTLIHELNESGMARHLYRFKNSWMLYRDTRVQEIKQDNPKDRRTIAELAKLISKEWNAMTDEDKEPWVEEAEDQKEEHLERIEQQIIDANAMKRALQAAKKVKTFKQD